MTISIQICIKIGASFDPENARLVDVSALHNLDYGFEAYATQAFNAPDGRALAVSWLGLPDVSYPSDRFDHQGTFSLVKELTIKRWQTLSVSCSSHQGTPCFKRRIFKSF